MQFDKLRAVRSTALVCAAVLFATIASAQQMQKVSIKSPAENSTYVLQQNVDVGDAPNHIVRMYDVHRTYPTNPPVIAGLKIVEGSDRGVADYTDGNGSSTVYSVLTAENGDKVFIRSSLVAQSAAGKLTAMTSGVELLREAPESSLEFTGSSAVRATSTRKRDSMKLRPNWSTRSATDPESATGDGLSEPDPST
jgi:hypothetical protein